MTYISKNFYSPKYGESRNTTFTTGNSMQSPKVVGYNRDSKPLFKSSKYLINKTENPSDK